VITEVYSGEALSHLEYLVHIGLVVSSDQPGRLLYGLE